MAEIRFNFIGFAYQEGVKRLAEGFASASDTMRESVAKATAALAAYEADVAAGGQRIGEWEDGVCLWEQDDLLRMRVDDAKDARMDLRKAFAMASYHHWERWARRWTRRMHGKHHHLTALTIQLGHTIDPGLDALRDLVNALKHNNPNWGAALIKSWPGIVTSYRPSVDMDLYEAIELGDAHVIQILDIIGRSGPTAETRPEVALP